MFSNPEVFANYNTISPMTSTPVNKTRARKSLCLFTNILYVKNKTATRQVRSSKSNPKVVKYGTTPWA